MVVLATPVRTIVELIGQIGSLLAPGCLLTDVGSTKQAVVQALQELPPNVQSVGGHPMCGKETAGLVSVDYHYTKGQPMFSTPWPAPATMLWPWLTSWPGPSAHDPCCWTPPATTRWSPPSVTCPT